MLLINNNGVVGADVSCSVYIYFIIVYNTYIDRRRLLSLLGFHNIDIVTLLVLKRGVAIFY